MAAGTLRSVKVAVAERAFRRVIGGQWVSALGDGAFQVGLAFTCLEIGGARLLSLVFLAKSVAAVGGLALGGALTDRFSPRRMLITSDLVRGLAVLAVGMSVLTGETSHLQFVVLGAIFGLGDGIFEPAYDAAIPHLVAPELIVPANTVVSTARRLATMLGPAVGGVMLAAFGPAATFLGNGASYALAFVATAFSGRWSHSPQSAEPHGSSGVLADIRDGAVYVLQQRWLLFYMFASAVIIVFVFAGVFVLLPDIFQRGSGVAGYAAVVTAVSVGGLLGALCAPRLIDRRGDDFVVYSGLVLTAVGYGSASVLSHSFAVYGCAALAGAATSIGNIAYVSVLQQRIAPQMLGRVFAFDALASYGLSPIAYAALAAFAAGFDPSLLFACLCALGGVLVLATWAGALAATGQRQVAR